MSSWAEATYNAASDAYDDPANAFWARSGRLTLERLALPPGARVLDVACGTGASALPAAEAVGASGSVLGVDLAEDLLALARDKAHARGLRSAEFRRGDMLALDEPDGAFDAVVCVFGIFFVEDMAAAARELWRLVRPGGRLAVTTWGPRVFEPGDTVWRASIDAVRPDLAVQTYPWERVSEPHLLRAVFEDAGISGAEVVAHAATHPLRAPEDWWTLVLGTGYRGTLEQLTPEERERVRRANLDGAQDIEAVEVNLVLGVAARGAA